MHISKNFEVRFTVSLGLEDKETFDCFSQAFVYFMSEIKKTLAEGGSRMWLDETCNIVMVTNDDARAPMNFYVARDLGYKLGLMKGHGEIIEGATLSRDDYLQILDTFSVQADLVDKYFEAMRAKMATET